MNVYICPDLKTLYWKYLAAFVLWLPLLSAAQEAQDTVISQIPGIEAHVGGADEEEAIEAPLFNESPAEMNLSSVGDSLAHIPAYDMYCGWDTRNLFAQKNARENLGTGLKFELSRIDCDFVFPTDGDITSPFGPRWGRMHYGLDLDLETGDRVMAAFEGMVRISQFHASYGNVVVIRHNNGLETLYAHLSQRKVKPGDHVEAGDLIGLGGNTGRSYGAHLHFEVRYLGEAIDPNLLVDPSKKSLRDWEFVLQPSHFEYASIDPKALEARKGASTQKKYHVVKKGETLSAISRKHKTSVAALCKINRIKKTSILRPGQKIRIR